MPVRRDSIEIAGTTRTLCRLVTIPTCDCDWTKTTIDLRSFGVFQPFSEDTGADTHTIDVLVRLIDPLELSHLRLTCVTAVVLCADRNHIAGWNRIAGRNRYGSGRNL